MPNGRAEDSQLGVDFLPLRLPDELECFGPEKAPRTALWSVGGQAAAAAASQVVLR